MRKIVALNCTPNSINYAHLAIKSLLGQLCNEDKLILYLSKKQFEDCKLPEAIKQLMGDIVSVCYIDDDLGRHNSYYYAMRDYPEDIVILGDDNIEYPDNTIELLLSGHELHPNEIICLYGKTIAMSSPMDFLSFPEWKKEIKIVNKPSHAVYASIGTGVLFPPHSLSKVAFDKNEIRFFSLEKVALWLNLMAIYSGTRILQLNDKWKYNKIKYDNPKKFWDTVEKKSDDEAWEVAIKRLETIDNNIRGKVFDDYLCHALPEYRKLPEQLKIEKFKVRKLKKTETWRAGKIVVYFPKKIKSLFKIRKKNEINDEMYNVINATLGENGYKLEMNMKKYLRQVNRK